MAELLKPGVTFAEAIAYAVSRKVKLPRDYYGKLVGVQRSQAVSIAGLASLEQIKYVIDQVNKVIDGGGTFADFQKSVKNSEFDPALPRYRLVNVFRTNVQGAYSRGRYEQQERHKSTRPYLMYDAINDGRTRPTHAALDGTILPFDHPFWQSHYTPNGYMCRCTVISLTEKQAQRRGITAVLPIVEPDEGWSYNPGQEYTRGPTLGLQNFRINDSTTTAAVSRFKDAIQDRARAAISDQSAPGVVDPDA